MSLKCTLKRLKDKVADQEQKTFAMNYLTLDSHLEILKNINKKKQKTQLKLKNRQDLEKVHKVWYLIGQIII